jgi:hypothetical protein
MVLWLFLELVCDVAIAGPLAGFGVLIDVRFLFGYFLLLMSVLLFHKKRHVHKRRELAGA